MTVPFAFSRLIRVRRTAPVSPPTDMINRPVAMPTSKRVSRATRAPTARPRKAAPKKVRIAIVPGSSMCRCRGFDVFKERRQPAIEHRTDHAHQFRLPDADRAVGGDGGEPNPD